MHTVLHTLAETIRYIGILMQPFVPTAAGNLLDQLAIPAAARDFVSLAAAPLAPGTVLPKPAGIFPRLVDAPAA